MKKSLVFILLIIAFLGNSQTLIKYKQMENPATSSVNFGTQILNAGNTTVGSFSASSVASPGIFNFNRNYLRDFDAQIAKVMQGTASSKAVIAWFGDSWTAQGLFSIPTASDLRVKYGDAGAGYYGAGSGNSSSGSITGATATSINRVGTWTNNSQNTYIMSAAIAVDSSSNVNDSIYFVGVITDAVIHYMKKASGGSFVARVDGTSPTTVSTSGSTSLNFFSITGLTDGTHTISIKVSSAGSGVLIAGCELNRNQNGVRVHNLGCSGSTATEWMRQDSTNWTAGIQQLAPNLAIITLAVNDCSQGMTTTTYIGNITRMVNRIKAAMPNVAICLFTPADIGIASTYPMSAYVSAAKSYALANNYSFIDNYSILGPYAAGNARGLYANTTHINARGGNILVQNFLNYLQNGVDATYTTGNNYGIGNTALLNAAASGTPNTVIGYGGAGGSITTATGSTIFGWGAGASNKTRNRLTVFGHNAFNLSTAGDNAGFGWGSGAACTTCSYSAIFGNYAGNKLTTGNYNNLFGYSAGINLLTGSYNVYNGYLSANSSSTGDGNIGIGSTALYNNSGNYNVAIGYNVARNNAGANGNVYIGNQSGYYNSTGSNNFFGGQYAGLYPTNLSNRIYFNTIDRANINGDTAVAPIYIYEASTTENQRIYLNASVIVGQGLKIGTSTSSATTLTLTNTFVYYTFTGGSAATWTLPTVTGNTGLILVLKNEGSVNITLNSSAGGNDIYNTSAGSSLTITPGSSYMLINDGTYYGVN